MGCLIFFFNFFFPFFFVWFGVGFVNFFFFFSSLLRLEAVIEQHDINTVIEEGLKG